MNVNFSEVDKTYIKSKVQAGFYTNETELVRDAVRHMREEDERRARFRAAVKMGDDQIDNGQTVAYTDELLGQITEEAMQQAEKGAKPNSDVASR